MSVKSGYSYYNATVGLLMLLTMSGNFTLLPMIGMRSVGDCRRPASRQASRSAAASRAAAGLPTAAGDGLNANCPSNPDDLISDFESDNSLAPVGGRQGGWYTYGDDVGDVRDRPSGFNIDDGQPQLLAGRVAAHQGDRVRDVGRRDRASTGSRVPATATAATATKMTYDASAYRGIAFWAKASAPLDGVQVSFPDLYTDNAAPKHDMPDPLDPATFLCTDCVCKYVPGFPNNCSPYLVQFGKKGDAAARRAVLGYASVPARHDLEAVPGAVRRHAARTPATAATTRRPTTLDVGAPDRDGDPDQRRLLDRARRAAHDFEIWLDDVTFIK